MFEDSPSPITISLVDQSNPYQPLAKHTLERQKMMQADFPKNRMFPLKQQGQVNSPSIFITVQIRGTVML